MENAMMTLDVSAELSEQSTSTYCSIKGGDRATKAKLYNASNNPDHKVGDFINKSIKVKDVLVEAIDIVDEDSGKIERAPRVVLIDDKGKAYQAVSMGIFNAVKKAIQIFGEPTWDEPIEFTVKQVSVKNGSMLTLDVAE